MVTLVTTTTLTQINAFHLLGGWFQRSGFHNSKTLDVPTNEAPQKECGFHRDTNGTGYSSTTKLSRQNETLSLSFFLSFSLALVLVRSAVLWRRKRMNIGGKTSRSKTTQSNELCFVVYQCGGFDPRGEDVTRAGFLVCRVLCGSAFRKPLGALIVSGH